MADQTEGKAVTINEYNRLARRVFTEKWKTRECPICISYNCWNIEGITEVREFTEGNQRPSAPITPLVQVMCKNCSYTIFFNAVALGVVDRETCKLKETNL